MNTLKASLVVFAVIFASISLTPSLSGDSAVSPLETAEQCAMCHEEKAAGLKGTPHVLPAPDRPEEAGVEVFCQDCHRLPEKHLEEPSVETAVRAADLTGTEALALCSTCHSSRHIMNLAEGSPHLTEQVSCVSCHTIHTPTRPFLLKDTSTELCLNCHHSLSESFSLPSHHPVKERNLQCVDCHNVLDAFDAPFSLESSKALCVNCHTEYEGPFPYEHQAVNDYVLEGHGCLSCHEAHGSVNGKLLREPGRGVCLKCHLAPKHFTAHGGIWGKVSCLECHTDVHGSYSNEKFFREGFVAEPCFQAGCHSD
ncbi:MAG: cytochrome c3 family protein [Candidatus Eiseniibacteriota bacterium]|nr:MAG: cytochrome c3 family protein [Candidatus Eisenbacteria bacterium]